MEEEHNTDPYGIEELYAELRSGPQESHEGDDIQEARNRQARIQTKSEILIRRGLDESVIRRFKVDAYANAFLGDPESEEYIKSEYLKDDEELLAEIEQRKVELRNSEK